MSDLGDISRAVYVEEEKALEGKPTRPPPIEPAFGMGIVFICRNNGIRRGNRIEVFRSPACGHRNEAIGKKRRIF